MDQPDRRPVGWRHELAYIGAWAVATVFIGANFLLARDLTRAILIRIGASMPYETIVRRREAGIADYDRIAHIVTLATTVVLACVSLALVIYIERYLDKSVEQHRLVRATIRTLLTLALVGISMYITTWVMFLI